MSRFVIRRMIGGGSVDLLHCLPLGGDTLAVRTGAGGRDVFYAVLDEPVKHRPAGSAALRSRHSGGDAAGPVLDRDECGPFLWVREVVLFAQDGQQAHYDVDDGTRCCWA